VVVDVGDNLWPRWVPVLKRVAAVTSLAVVVTMCWAMVPRARDILDLGDVTSDLSLPRILYWIPVLAGVAGAGVAALTMIFRRKRGG
jgi:hypothetical protein